MINHQLRSYFMRVLTLLVTLLSAGAYAQISTFQLELLPLEAESLTNRFLVEDDTCFVYLEIPDGAKVRAVTCGNANCSLDRQDRIRVECGDSDQVQMLVDVSNETTGRMEQTELNFDVVQRPQASINNVPSDSLLMSMEFLLAGKLNAAFPEFDLELKVDSFAVSTVRDGQVYYLRSDSNKLTREMREVFFEPEIAQEAYFYDVWVSWGTGSSIRAADYRVFVIPDIEGVTKWSTGAK